ncbi:MAG: transporter substrate-binding domain-containing protein [Alphaproteobacteria bacterium]|nr:transporter substrate-binding domain-containing protein [Alphaproteobacteria bacterium]
MTRPAITWLAAALIALAAGLHTSLSHAQSSGSAEAGANNAIVAPQRVVLRFLTTSDYPPFNFYDEDGVLTGFNVDLARAICLELEVTCEILERSWNQLLPSLAKSQADAVIAAHSVTAETLKRFAFSDRYFHTPGRFAGLRRDPTVIATPEGLESKRIAVASGSAHEAFLRQYFRGSRILVFDNPEIAREALKAGEVDVVFGDAISLSFWVNGTASEQCCDFKGGAYLEPKFFGDGIAIAISKEDLQLKAEIDNALLEVRAKGRFAELVTRYFPYRLY